MGCLRVAWTMVICLHSLLHKTVSTIWLLPGMTGPPAGHGGISEGGFSWPSYPCVQLWVWASGGRLAASCKLNTWGAWRGGSLYLLSMEGSPPPAVNIHQGQGRVVWAEAVPFPIPPALASCIFTRQLLPLTWNPSDFMCHSENWKTAKCGVFL